MESEEYKKGFKEGYEKALDDHNILHGDAADNFLAQMKKTEEEGISKEQKKFLDECVELVNNKE